MGPGRVPAVGEFYRHFKGNLYQIIGVAKHSETGEELVVYQALYGDYRLYVRPLEMFVSKVDKEKYPAVEQEYRFEKVEPGNDTTTCVECSKERAEAVCEEPVALNKAQETMQSEIAKGSLEILENMETEETVREEILRFLDAEGAEGKLKVLREIRMDLDEELLTTIELSLDMLPNDKESLERRYDFVEHTLEQRVKFEGSRLR